MSSSRTLLDKARGKVAPPVKGGGRHAGCDIIDCGQRLQVERRAGGRRLARAGNGKLLHAPNATPLPAPAERLAKRVAVLPSNNQRQMLRVLSSIWMTPFGSSSITGFAKLQQFRTATVKEFGSQQVGGMLSGVSGPGSRRFQPSDIRKRVLGFLPEEKLADLFLRLGPKIASDPFAAVLQLTRVLGSNRTRADLRHAALARLFFDIPDRNAQTGNHRHAGSLTRRSKLGRGYDREHGCH